MKNMKIAITALALTIGCGLTAYAQSVNLQGPEPTGKSEWVWLNADGKLEYKTTERGDRIMDFSHAGYMGGGVVLPTLPVRRTISPPADGADATQLIQDAINEVSALSLDENGFRGAVLLAPGEFVITRQLLISASGVVLRGSVDTNGELQSTIRLHPTGERGFRALQVAAPSGGGGQRPAQAGDSTPAQTVMVGDYVPSGIRTFRVQSANGFQVGDRIEIQRPVTAAWVESVVMHDLVRDGRQQTWMPINSRINMERRITAIDGNQITVDVPLADSYDMVLLNPPGVNVVKLTRPSSRVNQVGIEYLRITGPEQPFNHSDPRSNNGIHMNAEDSWIRNVRIYEMMDTIRVNGHRITLQHVDIIRRANHTGSSRPAAFAPDGGQILVDRCTVNANNVWFVATGGRNMGPIVILNCTFWGNSRAEGHARWSTAMLVDNCSMPDGRLDFINRGVSGSGHGWALAWSVAWNVTTRDIVIQEPPGTRNWAIGSTGRRITMSRLNDPTSPRLPEGTFDSHGTHVAPRSLYLAQLLERLGPEALRNIGY